MRIFAAICLLGISALFHEAAIEAVRARWYRYARSLCWITARILNVGMRVAGEVYKHRDVS